MLSMQNLQTLPGFRDFLPDQARKRAWLRGKMIEVFQRWGYEPLETPTVEPLDIFLGQIGEDEKLFYQFEDRGGRKVALRYDQTVPTCRVIGQYANRLTFPFRRYQIQSNFRAEKPQKGRYREFTQADIDIFGVASPTADAETIAVSIDLYKTLGFKKVTAIINNRDLMKGIPYEAIVAIDKLKKIGKQGVIDEMVAKKIPINKATEYLEFVENIQPDETIKMIFDYLESAGFSKDYYEFSPTLARSFSYSQGPIWEMVIPQYSAGSVGGGERYDNMLEKIGGVKVPATGIAFGFDRTLEALESCNLLPDLQQATSVLVTVFNPNLWNISLEISREIRESSVNCELYPDQNIKFDKQLKYADKKGIPFAVIAGPDEVARNTVTLKDLKNRTQYTVAREKLAETLKTTLTEKG